MFSRGEPRGEGGRRDVGRAAALHRRDTLRPARLSHWRHRERVKRVALREGDGEEGATPRVDCSDGSAPGTGDANPARPLARERERSVRDWPRFRTQVRPG